MNLFQMLIGDDKPREVKTVVDKNGNKKEESKNIPFMQPNGKTTEKSVTIVTKGDGPTLALTLKNTSMALSYDEFEYIKEMTGCLDEKTDLVWAEAQEVEVSGVHYMALKENGAKYEYVDKRANFNIGKLIDSGKPKKPAKPKNPPKSSTT